MSKIKIDKGIPVPGSRPLKLPFEGMKVGDSFFVPEVRQICGAIRDARNRTGHEYTSRTVRENGAVGFRVWRTK